MRARERTAALLGNLLGEPQRSNLARALDLCDGKIAIWCCETLADGSVFPAFAIVQLPKAVREEFLRTLAEWGDLSDRGEL